ncbi:calcium/sodium antiporter [Thermosipho atlanticus]|uniref:Cation:H+ antiporter n=1 Tax=Thermosipho atlanticus DSM 15807 TaxID=1123380 RepID=A0A1M5R7Q2_9BACT|nr:calcium/sodium antiporter [Thermosipho atlanticus]SHH22049.1 cation:H+ antiporter [Thermosipho atlanticus DSM 15807]
MFWILFGLVIGMSLLIKGADWLVDGAVSIALNMGISKLIVGLSIVAFGTSVPELVASVISVIKGHSSVSISNVVGSNMANIALCLALAALISTINIKKKTVTVEMPFMLLSTLVFSSLLLRDNSYILKWNDGIVFLSFMIIFIYYLVSNARDVIEEELTAEVKGIHKTSISILLVIIGIAGISIGGELTIRNVVELARMFNLSETLVGLTIVAIGTSLPELVVSITSVIKGEGDILVGNIVGSNIFNILLIIGISSLIGNLTVDVSNYFIDLMVVNLVSILLLLISILKKKLTRIDGFIFLSIYILYILFIAFRG